MLLKQTILFTLLLSTRTIQALSFYTNFITTQLAMRDANEMPVAAIKEEIRLRGGKLGGVKAVLVKRLKELRKSNDFINDEALDEEEKEKEADEDYKDAQDDEDEELKASPTDELENQSVS